MRPYKVLLFIACVMACLAALCLVLPHRIALGEKEVRWPTLAEVMGSEPVLFDTLELVDTLALAEVLSLPDTIVPDGYHCSGKVGRATQTHCAQSGSRFHDRQSAVSALFLCSATRERGTQSAGDALWGQPD